MINLGTMSKAVLIDEIHKMREQLVEANRLFAEYKGQMIQAKLNHERVRKYADQVHAALDALVMESKAARIADARLVLAEHHAKEEF